MNPVISLATAVSMPLDLDDLPHCPAAQMFRLPTSCSEADAALASLPMTISFSAAILELVVGGKLDLGFSA